MSETSDLPKEPTRGVGIVLDLAAIGPVVVGVTSLIAALSTFFGGDYVGAGVLMIASALSFGLLSLAVFGK